MQFEFGTLSNELSLAFDLPDAGDLEAILCYFNPRVYKAPVDNL